jgi:undecaprenyl-phosphate galactose phosphotransferase
MLDLMNGQVPSASVESPAIDVSRFGRRTTYSECRRKRAFDIIIGAVLVVLASPLLLAIALLIRCEGRTVLFRHRRIGRNGAPFWCLKFRTMRPDAEAILKDLLNTHPAARAEWERDFKLRCDPRITQIGGVLRKTSLDELPQLFNVLRGEMSLVGPRPIVEAEMPRYGAAIAHYFRCRPGLTGVWQVAGRNDTGYAQRVRMDVEYSQAASLGGDLAILARTARAMLVGKGAY